jgi:hypothetical protein
MPTRFWHNDCCNPRTSSASQRCDRCGRLATRSYWALSMHESMLRYQLHFGVTPIGPHRKLTDALAGEILSRCPECGGSGLIVTGDMSDSSVCPTCHAFGSLPLPNSPELKALRERVRTEYPDSVVSDADAVTPGKLADALCGSIVIVQDLRHGRMVTAPAGSTRPPRAARSERTPSPAPQRSPQTPKTAALSVAKTRSPEDC